MGAVTTKTLVREERNFEEFKAESGKMRKASIRAAVLSAMFTPIVMTLGSVGTALALYAGGRTVIAAREESRSPHDDDQVEQHAPDHALHVGNIRCTAHVGLHVGERKPDHVAQELLVGNNQYSVHVLPPALPAASAAPKTVPEAHRGKKNCRICCL